MADGSIHIDTKLDTSGLEKGLSKLGGIAAKGFAAVGAALSGASVYAVKVGSDFEAAMSEVAAISGAVGEDFQLLVDRAKELGASTKFSASDAAEGLKYMAMAGWEVQEMYDALPGVMHLAAASGEPLGAVSDIVTDAMTAFKMSADEAEHFADVLAIASSASNTNVGMMGETFKFLAPIAGALGYKVEDVAVAIGLLANQGIKAGQAGTYLRSAFSHLAAPSERASMLMERIGLSIADTSGQILPLDQLIQNLRTSFAGLTEAQQLQYASIIFGQEAGTAMIALLNSSQEEIDSLTESVYNCTGAAESMAEIMQNNLLGDVEKLQGEAETLGIAVYEHISEPLREAAQAGTQMVEQLNAALSEGGLEGLVAAAGNVLAELVNYVAGVVPQMAELAVQLIQSFVAGIANNAAAIATSASSVIVTFVDGVLSAIPSIAQAGLNIITHLVTGIASALPNLLQTAAQCIAQLVQSFISSAPQLATAGSSLIQSLGNGITSAMKTLSQTAVSLVSFLHQSIVSAIPKLADAASNIMRSLGQYLTDNLPTLIDTGLKMLVELTGSIKDNAGKIVDGAIALAKSLAQGLVDAIPTIIQNVPTIVYNIARTINENAPKILKAGIDIITTLVKGLIQNIPTLVANIPKIISAMVEVFIAFNWMNLGRNVIDILGKGITGAVGLARSAITTIMNTVKSSALSVAAGFIMVGKAIVQGIWNGISSLASWIGKKISAFGQTIIDGFKGLLGIHSPSRVMRDVVGKNIGLGIAEGIAGTESTVRKAIDNLTDTATTVDLSAKMRTSVEERNADIGSRGQYSSGDPGSGDVDDIDYDEFGKAVWRHAPPMEFNVNGRKVAEQIEPDISEIQAKKTKHKSWLNKGTGDGNG